MIGSTSTSLKILWSFSVVVLLFAATFHCYQLLIEQYTSSTVTSTNNRIAGLRDTYEDPTHFPDVTLCNLNPFMGNATHAINARNMITIKEYADLVNATIIGDEPLQRELLTSHGYFAYVREENATAVSHTFRSFAPTTNALIDVYGFRGKSEDWFLHGDVRNFTDYIHYRCFTFHAVRPHPEQLVVYGLSATVHLDNFFEDPYEYFDIEHDRGQYIGALITLHEPGTFPEIMSRGVYLPPGTLSDIKVKLRGYDRVENPTETCMETGTLVNDQWNHSRRPCISVCLEKLVMQECECMDLRSLDVLVEISGAPYCHGIHDHSMHNITERIKCADKVREKQLTNCQSQCHVPCYELDYSVGVSYADWPPKPLSYKFYTDEISGQPYENRYSIVSDVLYNSSASPDLASQATKLINDNFLHFNLYVADFRYLEYEEIARLSSFNLVAQLGGALNLWAGITVVVFVEAMDFFFNVVLEWHKQKKAQVFPPDELQANGQ